MVYDKYFAIASIPDKQHIAVTISVKLSYRLDKCLITFGPLSTSCH